MWVYRWCNFGNFPPKFVGVLRPLNFNYTFFKALLIFCQCRALFSSVLFLKIIVNNVLYRCTVNLSRHNYFLQIKIYYFIILCLFVYIIKRTLHGGLNIWILFSCGKIIFYSLAGLVHKIIIVSPLENKIHTFAPPCNILSIYFYNAIPLQRSISYLFLTYISNYFITFNTSHNTVLLSPV